MLLKRWFVNLTCEGIFLENFWKENDIQGEGMQYVHTWMQKHHRQNAYEDKLHGPARHYLRVAEYNWQWNCSLNERVITLNGWAAQKHLVQCKAVTFKVTKVFKCMQFVWGLRQSSGPSYISDRQVNKNVTVIQETENTGWRNTQICLIRFWWTGTWFYSEFRHVDGICHRCWTDSDSLQAFTACRAQTVSGYPLNLLRSPAFHHERCLGIWFLYTSCHHFFGGMSDRNIGRV